MSSGRTVSVCKAKPNFRPWNGPPPIDTSGGKPVLEYEGQPLFAELVILRILQMDGWDGAWVDSYSRRFCVGIGQYQSLPADREMLLSNIYQTAGRRGGCFDVFAWRRDSILFAESKWKGHDRIRKSQVRWLSAALDTGLPLESFLVVEWSVG